VALVAQLGLAGCTHRALIGPTDTSMSAPVRTHGQPIAFSFDSLDARRVDSLTLRGKPAVLAFVASDDLASQAEASFLASMAKNDGDRVTYVLIAVEGEGRRELVEGFRSFFESKFGVSLRTGMADQNLLEGQGPFGDVRTLTVVVLDPAGKVVWQKTGIAKPQEIRAGMREP
jgi:hypothetical protein